MTPPPLLVVLAAADGELDDLRRRLAKAVSGDPQLPVVVLDLPEEGEAPAPVTERLEAARRADVLVALLAARYDEPPPGLARSIAHLMYDEALASNHAALLGIAVAPVDEPEERLRDWRRRIERRCPVHDVAADDPHLVDDLRDRLRAVGQGRLVALGLLPEPGAPGSAPILTLPASVGTILGSTSDPDPVAARLSPMVPPVPLLRDPDGGHVAEAPEREPARVAADEQWNEATRAWQALLWGDLVDHLEAGHGRRPLDAPTGALLARAGLASGRFDRAVRALQLAERAADVALLESDTDLATSSLLVAARAARAAGADGRPFAGRAHELRPDRPEPLVELALGEIAAGRIDLDEPVAALAERYPAGLLAVAGDPALVDHEAALVAALRAAHDGAVERVRPVVELANELRHVAETDDLDRDDPLLRVVDRGCRAARQAHDDLRDRAKRLIRLQGDIVQIEASPPWRSGLPPHREPPSLGRAVAVGVAAAFAGLLVGWPFAALTGFDGRVAYFAVAATILGLEAGYQALRERRHDAAVRRAAHEEGEAREEHLQQLRTASDRRYYDSALLRRDIDRYEEAVAAWWLLAPTVGLDVATVGDLVSVDTADPPEGWEVDLALLPRDIATATGAEGPPGPHVLCRVVEQGERPALSRRSAYFS